MATASQPVFEIRIQGAGQADHFSAFLPDASGQPLAESPFTWEAGRTELALLRSDLLKASEADHPPAQPLHVDMGRRLYAALFGPPGQPSALGEEWAKQRKAAGRGGLTLLLRIDPATAWPLLRQPWEYLHDDRDFLALDRRTPVVRIPWDADWQPAGPITETLRLLVMVSAPVGPGTGDILDLAREEDVIVNATLAAQAKGELEVVFAPNGRLATLEDYLAEWDPHILHFIGHGGYDEARQAGFLQMEGPGRELVRVDHAKFVEAVDRCARSLRAVFLVSCLSARPGDDGGMAGLGDALVRKGIPAVTAMQHSVLESSALAFASAFYEDLVTGQPLTEATARARQAMKEASPNGVDFAVPTLTLTDPLCLRIDPSAPRATVTRPAALGEVAEPPRFVGRAADLHDLQTHLDPEDGDRRAVVLHALGGMGKTALAARLARRMAARLDGVKAMRVSPSFTAQDLLDGLAGFLKTHNGYYNLPAVAGLRVGRDDPGGLEDKAGALAAVLARLRLLVILDNYEDVLAEGSAVSKGAAQGLPARLDPDLPRLVRLLIKNVPRGSRFLFTSRVDFDPTAPDPLPNAVEHVELGDLPLIEAAYLMGSLPPLAPLPLRFDPAGGITKKAVYDAVGGHPYSLQLFAAYTRDKGLPQALAGLRGLRGELLAYALIEGAANNLTPRALDLLRKAAVYNEPVPAGGLAFLLGGEQDAMPPVADEINGLRGWGLLTRLPGADELYAVPALARQWAWDGQDAETQRALQRRAADYWLRAGQSSTSIDPQLSAWAYLDAAGEHQRAFEIVDSLTELLERWGQYELLLGLLERAIQTLSGRERAVALHNQGVVLQDLGNYPAARQRYEQSLEIKQQLGDRAGIAISLHQLGMLLQLQGDYPAARQRYEQSLEIKQQLGDRAGIASSLHQLGMLLHDQGDYPAARQRYEQALATFQELGDRASIATSLHQLGILLQDQGDYPAARQRYEQALATFQELGDRASIATSLHQLGMLLQQQGDYPAARQRYEQSLEILQQLGNRAGIASSLHQLGRLAEEEGNPEQAAAQITQAFLIFDQLGSPNREIARSSLARLREKMGEDAFNTALQPVLKDWQEQQRAGLLRQLVSNTFAVLRSQADQRGAWWEQLRGFQAHNRADQPDLAAFAGVLMRLLERQGADPRSLTPQVPESCRAAWEALIEALEEDADHDETNL